MCPSWVFCCAPWLDIPAGCPVVLSGPMMGTHYIQPIAFVTECRRFGLMQFPSSQLPFFILTLRLFHHSRSLLSAGCIFDFCCIANAVLHGLRVALLGMREITVNFYSFPSLFSQLLSSSLRACSGLASSLLLVPSRTICSCLIFGPNCQLFGTNLRLCTIRSALFLPSVNRDLVFCKNEASLGPFRSGKTVHNRKFLPFFAESGHGLGRVGPFGFAVKGFMGGAAGMDSEEPDQINAIRMDAGKGEQSSRMGMDRFIVRISARQQRTAPCLSRKKQGAVRLDV